MVLKLLLITAALDSSIGSGLRESELHRLLEELEALDFLDGLGGTVNAVEDDESLALGFQIRLCHNIDNFAIFREELSERFFQLIDLDALFEVTHIYAVEECRVS